MPNRHLPAPPPPSPAPGPRRTRRLAGLLAGLLAWLPAGPSAGAEAPADAVAAAAAAPQAATVETFQDWMLECAAICRLMTAVAGAEGEPVLRLSVVARGDGLGTLVIETPLPLYLPDPVSLAARGREPVSLPWHTCGAAGCEARTGLAPALLEGLRRERAAAVSFTLVDGQRVRLPVSLMGFTAGERALRAAGG